MCEIDAPKVSRDQELVELLTVELVVELPMIAEVGKWSVWSVRYRTRGGDWFNKA